MSAHIHEANVVDRLVETFDRLLQRDLGPNYTEAIRRNRRDDDPSLCATHDFIDANETMAEAFALTCKRPPTFTCNEAGDDSADVVLWNAAWAAWKDRSIAELCRVEPTWQVRLQQPVPLRP